MIVDGCKKLRQQLEKVAKAEANEKTVEQLNLRKKELLELKDKVIAATVSLQAIGRRTEIIGKFNATKAYERVKKMRIALKDDPQSITNARDLTAMASAFNKFTEHVIAATNATWEQYLPRARPNVDANQVAQAEQQEAFKKKADELRSRVKHAEFLSKGPPATESEFVQLVTVWQAIRILIASLPAVTKDPKVRDFLKAANSPNGAALDMLTKEVLLWLNENKASDKYRIVNL